MQIVIPALPYRSWKTTLRRLSWSAILLLLTPGFSEAQQADGARLTGRVLDAANGDGIEGAEVRLDGTLMTAVTNSRGRFRFNDVPPGVRIVQIARLGFESRADTIEVPQGMSITLDFPISVEPILLEPIIVSLRSLLLEMRGFYDRQAQGFSGFFADRATIEDADPVLMTDLFRSVPGVEVINNSRLLMSQSVDLRGGGRGCEPSLWLDGARSGLRQYDHLRPDHIEGIEVYTGGGAPGKYNDLCGTVVIWTRVIVRAR